jgi:AraC-like DNA-binding protein
MKTMNISEYENYHENIFHGEMIFPYNTYICTIPLDFPEVPLHWHDEMELIYIKKGQGTVTVDFREYAVKSPALVLILPRQLHSIGQWESFSMEYENIIFHPSLLISRQTDATATDFLLPLISGQITVPTLSRTKPQGYELYIKSQLYQFFFILSNRCRTHSSPVGDHKTLEKMKQVLKYVENNYMEKITIADIAATVDYSESHFMRYFKETMGISFIGYLKDYRLTVAARLLASSDSSVLDIASEVGFDNLSYFNRAFKQKYGMTPRQFREEST